MEQQGMNRGSVTLPIMQIGHFSNTKPGMTSLASFVILFLFAAGLSMKADEKTARPAAQEADDGPKRIEIVWAGDADTNMLSQVSDLLSKSFQCRVTLGLQMDSLKDPASPDEIRHIAQKKKADILFLIVLADMPGSSFTERAYKDAGVAVINVAAFRPGGPTARKETNADLHMRRVQRESVRMVAQLLGLGICIFPKCALSVGRSEQELDERSVNLCPPCAAKAQEELRKRGALQVFSPPSKRAR